MQRRLMLVTLSICAACLVVPTLPAYAQEEPPCDSAGASQYQYRDCDDTIVTIVEPPEQPPEQPPNPGNPPSPGPPDVSISPTPGSGNNTVVIVPEIPDVTVPTVDEDIPAAGIGENPVAGAPAPASAPASASTPAPASVSAARVNTDAPVSTASANAPGGVLPDTGGPSTLVWGAGALLVSAGLLLRRVLRRV